MRLQWFDFLMVGMISVSLTIMIFEGKLALGLASILFWLIYEEMSEGRYEK